MLFLFFFGSNDRLQTVSKVELRWIMIFLILQRPFKVSNFERQIYSRQFFLGGGLLNARALTLLNLSKICKHISWICQQKRKNNFPLFLGVIGLKIVLHSWYFHEKQFFLLLQTSTLFPLNFSYELWNNLRGGGARKKEADTTSPDVFSICSSFCNILLNGFHLTDLSLHSSHLWVLDK